MKKNHISPIWTGPNFQEIESKSSKDSSEYNIRVVPIGEHVQNLASIYNFVNDYFFAKHLIFYVVFFDKKKFF